jgi:hypothetical protein
MKLITKAEWEEMEPRSQGYVLYMQSEHPGSELKGLGNYHPEDSESALLFAEGERIAVLEAQDSEE